MSERAIAELATLPPETIDGMYRMLAEIAKLIGVTRRYAEALASAGCDTLAEDTLEFAEDLEQRRHRALVTLGQSAVSRRSDASAPAE